LSNVRAIAQAAAAYAGKHEGRIRRICWRCWRNGSLAGGAAVAVWPAGGDVQRFYPGTAERAPVRRCSSSVETAADYVLPGRDLKAAPTVVPARLIVAASRNTVLRVNLAVAFATGRRGSSRWRRCRG